MLELAFLVSVDAAAAVRTWIKRNMIFTIRLSCDNLFPLDNDLLSMVKTFLAQSVMPIL